MTQNKSFRTALIWVGIIALFFMFFIGVRAVLLPFVLGVLLAYFLDPLVDRLQRSRLSRTIATSAVTIAFFTITLCMLAMTLPLISEQLMSLLQEIPNYAQSLSDQYRANIEMFIHQLPDAQEGAVLDALRNMSGRLFEMVAGFLEALFASGATVLNVISLLLITPVVTFYMLRDWDHIVSTIDTLLPRAQAETIRGQLQEIDRTISGFVRGQVMVCVTLSLFYVVLLSAAGLDFSLVIGAATGLLVIIPYVGWFAGAVTGVMVAFMQYDSWLMIGIIAGIFLAGQVIESYFLTPKLVGEQVGLHPVWIIFGMLSGGALFGFVGVLIAVPVTAVIGVLTRFTIAQYLMSDLYKGSKS